MSRPDGVIFDWGNTLVDYPLRTTEEQHAFLASFLLDHADLMAPSASFDIREAIRDADWLAAFNRENDDFTVRPFRERMRPILGDRAAPDLIDDLEHRLCERIFATAIAIDGAAALMTRVRDANLRICILSNTPWGTSPRHWRQELARHPLTSGAPIVLCGDVGHRKPHRDTFRRCLEELGTPAETTVMIGDNLASDIIGAGDCGLPAIWFRRVPIDGPGRHRVVETLIDLADALKV